MTRKSNLERDEIRAKFAAIMTGISRALERPEEAEGILRELKMAEKMDRKVLPNRQLMLAFRNLNQKFCTLFFLSETFVT